MSRVEKCSNKACGHDKTSHCPETYSSGDVDQKRTVVYLRCLAAFCDCTYYRAPKKDDDE